MKRERRGRLGVIRDGWIELSWSYTNQQTAAPDRQMPPSDLF